MLVSVSVPALRKHPGETPRSLICNHRAASAARQGRGKELAVAVGLFTSRVLSTSLAVAILAKGYREAAGHQPGGKGLTLGAGGLLLVGRSRILQVFVREEAQGHLASCCWLSPD